ncbi:MAG: SDR family oxidoreductase [Asticcacaulis sp.]|nr:SDR family oxidoreductase [Asticcacaulis sp.]
MSGVAVITGAGSGIGRAVAIALEAAGFTAVLAGRRREALEATARLGQGMHVVPADVTDADSIAALFDHAAGFGRVALLFNNAGMNVAAAPLDGVAVDDIQALIATNVTGAMLCAREAMRIMKAQSPQGGRIINNGSVSAYAPRLNAAAYTVSKHAMTGLTKALVLEGRPFGISCGQIDIGNTVTDMSERMDEGVLQADGEIRPEPRFDIEHVARTVVHMATLPPEANISFVTIMASAMPLYGRG